MSTSKRGYWPGVTIRFAGLLGWACLLWPASAAATFHEWKIDQFFSNADSSVQYIRFATTASGQQALSGHTLQSSALGTFTFGHDLAGDTANRHFVIATQGYVNLPGGIQPDFVSPGPLFARSGDTINFAGVDSVTFSGTDFTTLTAQSEWNEVKAINVVHSGGGVTLSGDSFSLKNFAGASNSTWQNIANPYDIDGDGLVKPLDVLLLIDELNLLGNPYRLPPRTLTRKFFLDVDADGTLKPLDIVSVIDEINAHASPPVRQVAHVPEPSMLGLALGAVWGCWQLRRCSSTRGRSVRLAQ